ncbi:MAG: glycerol dehydrogenase [Nitrospiraceae bacterium]|nr:glycerol dehydrogenase [Nitrospiraceae bacterium]
MITKTVFPGRYMQGFKMIDRLGGELALFGKKGLAVLAPSAHKTLTEKLGAGSDRIQLDIELFNRECCQAEIGRLCSIGRERGTEFVVAIGGGKAIDTGKIVADRLKVPVAVVPTIASTDAPCSSCAVVYDRGEVVSVARQRRNPDLVLVDTEIIANAPVRFLVSGMGDALATWFEAESCRATFSNNEVGEKGSMTSYALARLCYDTLLEFGVAAKVSCEAKAVTPALEHVVEANTLLSGLGFENGGLAAAHSIHNGLTVLPQTHHYYHGEKVAIGVLSSLFLTGKPGSVIDEVYTFCESVGLPTTLDDIGLAGSSGDDLRKAASRACAEGEFIHHEAADVSADLVVCAMLAADQEGRRRKKNK